MKKILISILLILILVSISSAILYISYIHNNAYARMAVSALKMERFFSDIEEIVGREMGSFSSVKDAIRDKAIESGLAQKLVRPVTKNTVTLYLKNGAAISGELLREDDEKYVILWKDGEVTFYADEVDHIERGVRGPEEGMPFDEETPEEWPYENEITIRLTNGTVLDAEVTDVDREKVGVEYPVEGGGNIEQDIKRSKIEYLIFKPIDNDESKKIEERLKELFPKMKFYKEGNFTVVTDSYITWVKRYIATLRWTYTDIYLNFFRIFKEGKPALQNFVVVFDDYRDFVEYAVADGVPGWAVFGYFDPQDKVLYLFNSLGDRFAEFVFEAMVGRRARIIDDQADKIKDLAGDEHRIAIEGMADEIKDKLWRYYNLIKGDLREQTFKTLRHEFVHELFSNWGLQNIVVSKIEKKSEYLIEKKKEFLETKDRAKKRKLLMELITLKGEGGLPDMQAANSWLAEGIATYGETDPPGSQNDRWLFIFQKMKREDAIYPLEHLTVYKIGSFPGVCPKAMLYAYAQSWAFVTFLMEEYPKEFMEYQKRLSEEAALGQEDIEWLLGAIGKDSKALEKELIEYMDRYEELEDPFIKNFEKWNSIFREFK